MTIKAFLLTFIFTIPLSAQILITDNKEINEAFELATRTVDINVRRGILAAGGDYGGEWTRDISINSWNAVSLLRPQVAEKSLLSVVVNDTIGHEYWDKIIWTIGAFNHFKITGDTVFLRRAYNISSNTMRVLEKRMFDKEYGLFKGPSVFNDGIAGYPAPIYDSTNSSSAVVDHKNSYQIKCLSTNCVFYASYNCLNEMGKLLKINDNSIDNYKTKANVLKKSIAQNFYYPATNKLNYLIDHRGNSDESQEGLGISFAILFKIIDSTRASTMTKNIYTSEFGIPSIYPDFKRYSKDKPGRHNNLIWPMVNGFYADALIQSGEYDAFTKELNGLTKLALDADKGDYNFREVYNPHTGKPDGGWQSGHTWESCKLQTWSATAYLRMILNGVVGIKLENNFISFKPYLPSTINSLELQNIKYRNSNLTIRIKGTGDRISKFLLDGKTVPFHKVSSKISGIRIKVLSLPATQLSKTSKYLPIWLF